MGNQLSDGDDLEAAFSGKDGYAALQFLYNLQRGQGDRPPIAERLTKLGICERAPNGSFALTRFGSKCADSAREYMFWIDRGRTIHGEGEYPATRIDTFRDKNVLEIGSGCGCNLMRLISVAKRAVGVELEPVYVRISKILARRESITSPEIYLAAGEQLPFRSETFDWTILFSSIQYMDFNRALAEASRVTRRGGFVLMSLTLFGGLRGHYKSSRTVASIAANTLWYQSFGRRLRDNLSGVPTGRPVHPTMAFMRSVARRNSLCYREQMGGPFGFQHSLVFEKR